MSGVWTSPTEFKEFDASALTSEIASRSRAQGIIDMALLPDPDEVLKKLDKSIPVYRSLLTDAHVWSTVQSRKSGVLSAEWGIDPAGEGAGKGANEKAVEICDLALSRLDVYQIISEILDAVLYGLTPVELVWEQADGCWLPARAEAKPAEWFKYNSENELRFVSADDEESGEALPDKKFIIARHHATYANPYGERTLSRCFWPVAFKRGGFRFWATFSEKYGMPFLVGKVPRGTGAPERGKLLSSLSQMVQDAVAVINNDESIEIMEASGKTASADVYEKLIQTANREVSKAVLGQTLTTEIDRGGSYAATKEHMEVRGDLVDQDKRMAANAMNALLAWITALNAESAEPPVFRFFEGENLQADRAERDDRLVDQGVRFTKNYYQRIYNLEDDDFDLADAAAGANRQKLSSFSRRSPRLRRGRWFPGDDNFIEFAEGRQAEVDALADNAARAAHTFIDGWIEAVKKHLTAAKNLRSAGETIADLYTHDSRFAEALADALLAADRVGVDSVNAELGDDDGAGDFARRHGNADLHDAGRDFARRHGNADLHDAGRDFARRQKLSSFSRRSPRPVRGRWFPGSGNFIEFAEAQWGPGKPFEDAVAFFKARSFTIAGVSNADLLGDVRSEIIRAMEKGRTLKDFRADVDAVFDRRGWTRLKPHRVRTIFQTNIQGAYQAARHRQMTSPSVTAARPYWRYVSIDDSAVRPEHRALHGKIFRHDHPFWSTWYPPNGFNCRCHAQTVSKRELERNHWTAETVDPTGGLFEPVTPDGVTMPARPLMPDRGWDGGTASLLKEVRKREAKGFPDQKFVPAGNNRPVSGMGRPKGGKIPDRFFASMSNWIKPIKHRMAEGMSREAALMGLEADIKKVMRISPNESVAALRNPLGELVKVDMSVVAHVLEKRKQMRERYFGMVLQAIEDPYEIILQELVDEKTGDRRFRNKYISPYRNTKGEKRVLMVVTDPQPEYEMTWTVFVVRDIDQQRKGVKVLHGK